MNGLEITVLLGVVVFAGAVLSPRLRVAAPLLLLVGGLLLGFVPALREVQLPAEVVLLLFLPVMLFWESLTTSLRSIKRDFRGIVISSTLLVVVTAFAAAGIAYGLGMPWAAALVLGAAVAPPDATAVAALGRTLPRRNFMLLKAESLTNDGTALVLYAIAVGVAVGGSYTAVQISGLVLLSYVGGVAAGAVIAGVAYLVMRDLRDPTVINIALLLIPFAAYLLAELIDASGVLAVVVAGLIVSYTSGRISTAASRRQTESVWPLGSYLLNGSLFVLIGLEVQAVAHQVGVGQIGRPLLIIVAVWAGLILVRFLFLTTSVLLIRLLDRRPSQQARRMSYRARVVSAFAGFRGAVSLAIALSVPATMNDGDPFPARDDIILITAGVIVLTLLVQGPLLPAVVRWARLPDDSDTEQELSVAEHAITVAAVTALPELAEEHGISDEVRERLTRDYDEHLRLVEASTGTPTLRADPEVQALEAMVEPPTGPTLDTQASLAGRSVRVSQDSPLTRNEEYTRLRLALLDRKREVLRRLHHEGTIDNSVALRIQTRLDIEELRLTGVEPFD